MSMLSFIWFALIADASASAIVKPNVYEATEGYSLVRAAELPPACTTCRAGPPSISLRAVRSPTGVLRWNADALDTSSAWLVQSGDWQLVYWCVGVLDFEGTAMVHLREGAKYVVRCSASSPWNLMLEEEP
jgi:hypothetical protein